MQRPVGFSKYLADTNGIVFDVEILHGFEIEKTWNKTKEEIITRALQQSCEAEK